MNDDATTERVATQYIKCLVCGHVTTAPVGEGGTDVLQAWALEHAAWFGHTKFDRRWR